MVLATLIIASLLRTALAKPDYPEAFPSHALRGSIADGIQYRYTWRGKQVTTQNPKQATISHYQHDGRASRQQLPYPPPELDSSQVRVTFVVVQHRNLREPRQIVRDLL